MVGIPVSLDIYAPQIISPMTFMIFGDGSKACTLAVHIKIAGNGCSSPKNIATKVQKKNSWLKMDVQPMSSPKKVVNI